MHIEQDRFSFRQPKWKMYFWFMRTSILLSSLSLLAFFCSCSSGISDADLIGNWKAGSVVDTLAGYSEEEVANFETWAASLEWQFNSDHTFFQAIAAPPPCFPPLLGVLIHLILCSSRRLVIMPLWETLLLSCHISEKNEIEYSLWSKSIAKDFAFGARLRQL